MSTRSTTPKKSVTKPTTKASKTTTAPGPTPAEAARLDAAIAAGETALAKNLADAAEYVTGMRRDIDDLWFDVDRVAANLKHRLDEADPSGETTHDREWIRDLHSGIARDVLGLLQCIKLVETFIADARSTVEGKPVLP